MADPLSISTSIAGLVNLADIVFSRIYKYVKAIKSASKDIETLSSQISTLYGILSRLLLIANQLESEPFEPTIRVYHIHSCYETLEKLKNILDRDRVTSLSDQNLELLKRKLRWPFSSSEVKQLVTEIEQHKATLGLALQADGISGLLRALSKQNEIDKSLKSVQNELRLKHEAEKRASSNEQRRNVLDSFGTIDSYRSHNTNRKLRHPKTGLWLIESPEFKIWLESKNAGLWLYGIPGAGKTVLASLVIDEILIKSRSNVAVAYFYCDYKDPRTQALYRILGSLVQQIAKQDKKSFVKAEQFYHAYGESQKNPVEYIPEDLRDLIIDMATDYECTMIVVDGLDECGENTRDITELLVSLNAKGDTDLKTLLLSRDEHDIRECLKEYASIYVAAGTHDLERFVSSEIETRIQKKQLNIKTSELKERVKERLVRGAEGMFRWVICQLDYLCELPHDAARRKALDDLPRGLIPTYERLLRRVNRRNKETQKLVQRTLKWIAYEKQSGLADGLGEEFITRLTAKQLCQAISINFGDKWWNSEAVPEETEVLRDCSSLVRISVDGCFEFAHFTVEEFLKNIDPVRDREFAAYYIYSPLIETELTKTCLTYLNLQDFNQSGNVNIKVISNRFTQYPFRSYVVHCWPYHAERSNWGDLELCSLAAEFFHPSKRNTLISWAQDLIFLWGFHGYFPLERLFSMINRGLTEASALHYAVMSGVPWVCDWLLKCGCDVNQKTALGTPLHYALLHEGHFMDLKPNVFSMPYDKLNTSYGIQKICLLLENGADPNVRYSSDSGVLSPLVMTLYNTEPLATRLLLEKGAIVDEQFLDSLFARAHDIGSGIETDFLQYARNVALGEKALVRLLEDCGPYISRATTASLLIRDHLDDAERQSKHDKLSLHAAAACGQIEIIGRLLNDRAINIDAAGEGTSYTALHYASCNDHVEIAQTLIQHGASLTRADFEGNTALHHSVMGYRSRCLLFFLQLDADTNISNNDQLAVWHLAARQSDTTAITALLNQSASKIETGLSLVSKKGETVLMLAAKAQNIGAIELLLAHGSDVKITDNNGCNVVHYACQNRYNLHSSRQNIRLQILCALRDTDVDWNAKCSMSLDKDFYRDEITLLHLAALHEDSSVLEYLIDENLVQDIDSTTNYNETALLLAIWKGCAQSVAFLLSRNADPTIVANSGKSALQITAGFDHATLLKIFMDYGYDLEAPNLVD